MEHVLRIAACLHSLVSLAMLIAYYHLKVPLAIFKREKEIARRLEFEGLFIAEQPEDDDFKSHWDKLVISAKSFPVNYWDKFVKKKVRQKYSETYDFDSISNLLGMEKSTFAAQESEETGIFKYIMNIDWRYQVWKAGVTFTDNAFLYSLWYFSFSVMGNFNNFFFAAHLLDVAVGFKTLRTILQSVTHNGKQLVLTVMLLTIIVYIYTVIAFNFFRKFYIQEEDEEVDKKCHDMLTCFVFHLYKGVRAGGGIGDEIGDPDGDDYEVYRIIFDITFFFFPWPPSRRRPRSHRPRPRRRLQSTKSTSRSTPIAPSASWPGISTTSSMWPWCWPSASTLCCSSTKSPLSPRNRTAPPRRSSFWAPAREEVRTSRALALADQGTGDRAMAKWRTKYRNWCTWTRTSSTWSMCCALRHVCTHSSPWPC